MKSTTYSTKFSEALDYDRYVRSGTEEQARRWQQAYDAVSITSTQRALVQSFVRKMNVLVISGIWCGDCVQQGPLLQRIAEANPDKVVLRLLDRDLHKDLSSQYRINGGDRVPVAIFLAEDFELCSVFGERTLSRYRAIAASQLGASCQTGLVVPQSDEMSAALQDWLDEFERIQLMLRISPRLRKLHSD